jgi:UPF0176 protein
MTVRVAALYCFAPFDDPQALRGPLAALCCRNGIRGTLLLAREGINATIAGGADALDEVIDHIRALPGCDGLDVKFSATDAPPFKRMKVRVKREIVTLGVPDVDPARDVGIYVEPEHWNALISDPGTVLVDTRNDYEVSIGTFEGAIDPKTRAFGELPAWVDANRDQLAAGARVAMFCTGGIRCEKSTAYLRAQGFDKVFHLKGGILNYLEKIPEAESLWQGECFVFDERVSVGHGVQPGTYGRCQPCGWPLADGEYCRNCGPQA